MPKVSYDWLPLVIMGGAAICGGFLSLLLPETLGKTLWVVEFMRTLPYSVLREFGMKL